MSETPSPLPDTDAGEPSLSRRLGPMEIIMRKMATDPKHRNAGMSVWLLDQPADWGLLVERWDRASRVVPRMRQRLVDPPLGLGVPVWVTDADFDLLYHVRRVRLPEPGTFRQLLDYARTVLMTPSDPARSPWEIVAVEGLAGGRGALLQKGDHTMTDGQGGMRLMQVLCDLERQSAPVPMPAEPEPDNVGDVLRAELAMRLRQAPSSGVHVVGRAAGVVGKALRHPNRSATTTAELASSVGRMFSAMRTPKSPLLERRSLSHHYEAFEVKVDDLRRAGKTVGGSLNDAYVTALAGAMRLYHDRHGQVIDVMPMGFTISLRREGDPMASNRFTDLILAAPVGIADPTERMTRIRELILAARAEPALAATDSIAPIMSVLPTSVLRTAFSGAGGDMNASNIAGPPIPLYMAGAEILRLYGFAPLVGCPMIAGLMSVVGVCCIGVNIDPAAVPDIDVLVECLHESFAEVLDLGGVNDGITVPS